MTKPPLPPRPPLPARDLNEVRSDFNGDGRPDLAVTELRKVSTSRPVDVVHVLFGGPQGGFTEVGSQYFDHTTPGMPNDDGAADPHSEINDFGRALASGDFDDDGFADLAIGGVHDRFRVLYGGPSGLTTTGARMIRLGDVAPGADVPGEGITGENLFGSALTVGDFNGDGTDDLVAGAPRASSPWVGGVALLRGTPDGLSPGAAQWISGRTPGLPVSVETDGFGAVLASADFNDDGRDDLAVGFDRDHVGAAYFAGSVVILPGATDGLRIAAATMFYQDTPGIPDVAEYADSFGHALAAGDITGDGYPDLVVGTQSEGLSSDSSDRGGSVTVLRGSSGGLTVTGVQYLTQRTPGVPGSDEPAAQFGTELAFGDFNHDGRGDIAVGSPGETVGGIGGAGAITVFRGSPQGLVVTGAGRLEWTAPDMPASAAASYFYLGDVLHTVRQPDGGASLVVGSTNGQVTGGPTQSGLVMVFPGTTGTLGAPGGVTARGHRIWSAADLPVGAQESARFGRTLG
ncbi:FG-GAP-like repeat-containing protein [Plantactinospora soyae]|uniref:VCBS repeat-containing protein n=1 Tax=Plantactinospora soyae TaxID=1544732 RepID=A0A927M0L0_9ACTN|nr:FG-GAP-like repeat-containing protein [Plantactinospora soyae]MBE1485389.1 hypothetical protein [Plantactinospora soyae]